MLTGYRIRANLRVMSWKVEWYDESTGNEALKKLRRGAGPQAVKRVLRQIDLLRDLGLSAPSEHVKKVRGDLWELRATWNRNPYRILFYNPSGTTLVLLHFFHKTTDAILQGDIDRAERRMQEDRERR